MLQTGVTVGAKKRVCGLDSPPSSAKRGGDKGGGQKQITPQARQETRARGRKSTRTDKNGGTHGGNGNVLVTIIFMQDIYCCAVSRCRCVRDSRARRVCCWEAETPPVEASTIGSTLTLLQQSMLLIASYYSLLHTDRYPKKAFCPCSCRVVEGHSLDESTTTCD